MSSKSTAPAEIQARALVEKSLRKRVARVSRFKTGYEHYVFECFLEGADSGSVVARMNTSSRRARLEGAIALSRALRPLGVPLPEILHADLDGEYPSLILERFPGKDLGYVYPELNEDQLHDLATELARIQRIVSTTPSGPGFGYAVTSGLAPQESWSEVLFLNLRRSQRRLEGQDLIRSELAASVAQALQDRREELDRQAPIPFLHDITTKNVLIHDGKLSGIVDVDDLCFGDPLLPIALTRTSLLRNGENTRYIDVWMKTSGREEDQETLDLYTAVFCLDLISEYGMRFNGNVPQTRPEDLLVLEELLAQLLQKLNNNC